MKIETRGQTSLKGPPQTVALSLACVIDLFWAVTLWALCVRYAKFAPFPTIWTFLAFLAIYLFSVWLQLRQLSATLGQWIWKLKLIENEVKDVSGELPSENWTREWRWRRLRNVQLLQHEQLTPEVKSRATLLTTVLLLIAGFVVAQEIIGHPMMQHAPVHVFSPLVPAQNEQAQREWAVAPFYYAFGAWPLRLFGDPVFYSLPYQVGPPTRFIGKIIARWKMPDIQLVIEGPKTPTDRVPREEVKSCLTSFFLRCPGIRKAVLDRHVSEMLAAGTLDWDLSWFEVKDPPSAPEHAPQGIRLVGYTRTHAEERWILITPLGIHQALILQRSRSVEGEEASKMIRKVVQTLRLADSLTLGQSLASLRVSEIDLGKYQKTLDAPDLSLSLARAQAVLLAKISVDPKDLDAYFHLGGTSLLLLKHVSAMKAQMTTNSPGLSDKWLSLTQEWTAAAKPMIVAAQRYAQDIAPANGKTRLLKNMIGESEVR